MANYISCGEFYELIQLFINATKNNKISWIKNQSMYYSDLHVFKCTITELNDFIVFYYEKIQIKVKNDYLNNTTKNKKLKDQLLNLILNQMKERENKLYSEISQSIEELKFAMKD
jgi:hypothetical protein